MAGDTKTLTAAGDLTGTLVFILFCFHFFDFNFDCNAFCEYENILNMG